MADTDPLTWLGEVVSFPGGSMSVVELDRRRRRAAMVLRSVGPAMLAVVKADALDACLAAVREEQQRHA